MRLRVSLATFTNSTRPGNIGRNVVGVLLLVAIIGGFAWIAQYLPSWTKKPENPNPVIDPSEKPALVFTRAIAQWYPPRVGARKEGEGPSPEDEFPYKDFEQGADGYYDF